MRETLTAAIAPRFCAKVKISVSFEDVVELLSQEMKAIQGVAATPPIISPHYPTPFTQ